MGRQQQLQQRTRATKSYNKSYNGALPSSTGQRGKKLNPQDARQDLVDSVGMAVLVISTSVLVGLVAVGVFWNGRDGAMVFDDNEAITRNADVICGSDTAAIFRNNFWGQPMGSHNAQHQSYRPLTILTFRWDHCAAGYTVQRYHDVNIMLHAITSVLVTTLFARVLNQRNWSAVLLGGLLFAVHPIHTEAVTGLVGRADVLAGMFFVLSILIYGEAVRYHSAGSKAIETLLVAASIMMIGLSVLSKEIGITAAAAITVYEVFIVQRLDLLDFITPPQKLSKTKEGSLTHPGGGIGRLLFLWLGTGVILILRLQMNQQDIQTDAKTNPANHITNSVNRALTKNLYVTLHAWLLIFPRSLCCDWSGGSIDLIESIFDLRNFATLALYSAIAFLGVQATFANIKQWLKAELAFGLVLLIAPFIPATGMFMEVGFVLAERILYIPSIGFCFLIVSITNEASRHVYSTGFHWRSQSGLVFMVVVSLYTMKTVQRNAEWKDELSLYESGVAIAPKNAKLHHNYAYSIEGPRKEYHLKEAIRLYPPYVSAYINLGVHLSRTNRLREAIDVYKQAIETHYKHPLYSTDVGLIYRNMAMSYRNLGDIQGAIESYENCLKAVPNNPKCAQLLQQFKSQKQQPQKNRSQKQSDGTFDAVLKVTDSTYAAHRQKAPKTFIMFYAPWCGHCNEMKSDFGRLSKMQRDISIAAVDCTTETATCSKNSIDGYPALKYFHSSSDSDGVKYMGDRSTEDMHRWLAKQGSIKVSESLTSDDGEFDRIKQLSLSNFDKFRESHKISFVMFYAPWCSHCTDTKPAFVNAAKQLRSMCKFAAVDCTVNEGLCSRLKIGGYPTLIQYKGTSAERKHSGNRDAKSLVQFINSDWD